MSCRVDDEELDELRAAAARAGLTVASFTTEAALAAARGTEAPRTGPLREALAELMQARTQVRKYATNVNQAAAAVNVSGELPEWAQSAIRVTDAAVRRLDEAAATVGRRLP